MTFNHMHQIKMSTQATSPKQFTKTSGSTDAVWIHTEPYSQRPHFKKLTSDIEADVCIVGAGIAGITTAYELVKAGQKVVMIEAREVLSGETGRTTGHLSVTLGDVRNHSHEIPIALQYIHTYIGVYRISQNSW